MLSMFLMSFLGSTLIVIPGLGSLGLVLRSSEDGDAQLGGDTGGLEAPVDLGVRLRKAEGPDELGECIDEARDVFNDDDNDDGDTLEYGANRCCFNLSANIDEATPL